MDLILSRVSYTADGIFSVLKNENMAELQVGEHAYPDLTGGWIAKVPAGIYTCVRGNHLLNGMSQSFVTFEITNVPGHSGILLHQGNVPNVDSDGCLLLGRDLLNNMIVNSRLGFQDFMGWQSGCNQFQLTVID